jgi:hypothetical protein
MAKRIRRYIVTVEEISAAELPQLVYQAVGPLQTRNEQSSWFDRQDRRQQREKRLAKRSKASETETPAQGK